jgi:drug/metabolite transporter (DMT)-like permease
MTILLAIGCALFYGVGDYGGGRASRTAHSASVTVTAQAAGLLVLIPALFVIRGDFTARAMVFGALGGLSGEMGLLLLYNALSKGAMSVVSPIAAVLTAIVPTIAGVLLGETLGAPEWIGIAVACAAIGLISRGGSTDGEGPAHHARPTVRVLMMSVIAGVGFGLFVVALDRAGDGVGLWPLLAARPVGIVLAGTYAIVISVPTLVKRATLPMASLAGICDVTANGFAALATQRGKVAIAGVVIALYPASTVLLARFVDHEPITKTQLVGFALATAAVALIALA